MSYKRGMRQGDPLSPILFYLTEDVLSRGISYLVHSNQLVPMAGPHGCSTPTPVLYADDIMLLCKRTQNNLRTLMTFFKECGDISGQLLSLEKCKLYAGSMSVRRRNEITNILQWRFLKVSLRKFICSLLLIKLNPSFLLARALISLYYGQGPAS